MQVFLEVGDARGNILIAKVDGAFTGFEAGSDAGPSELVSIKFSLASARARSTGEAWEYFFNRHQKPSILPDVAEPVGPIPDRAANFLAAAIPVP